MGALHRDAHSAPSASWCCCSFSGAYGPLGDKRISSRSSRRGALDELACVRVRIARRARVSRFAGLLAASGLDLAHEMHMPVRACGVLSAESECAAPQDGWKGTLLASFLVPRR